VRVTVQAAALLASLITLNALVPAMSMPSLLNDVTLLVTVRMMAVFARPTVMLTVNGPPGAGVGLDTVNLKPEAGYFGWTVTTCVIRAVPPVLVIVIV